MISTRLHGFLATRVTHFLATNFVHALTFVMKVAVYVEAVIRGLLALTFVYAMVITNSIKRAFTAIRAYRGPSLPRLVYTASKHFADEHVARIEDHREDLVDHLWGL